MTVADLDQLLGCVLSYADENFDTALELGFASAIRREWAWRAKRGESLANLRAFARFADPRGQLTGHFLQCPHCGYVDDREPVG